MRRRIEGINYYNGKIFATRRTIIAFHNLTLQHQAQHYQHLRV